MRVPDLSFKQWAILVGSIIALIFLWTTNPAFFTDIGTGVGGCTRGILDVELDLDMEQIVPPAD